MTKPIITAQPHADAPLFALEAEIGRLGEAYNEIYRTRVEPHDEGFSKLFNLPAESREERFARLEDFDEGTGRAKGIIDADVVWDDTVKLIEQMWARPATTIEGRAAKVRVFLNHAAIDGDWWERECDEWDRGMARRLLLDLAGMTEADLDFPAQEAAL
jgi:hypothetical protein